MSMQDSATKFKKENSSFHNESFKRLETKRACTSPPSHKRVSNYLWIYIRLATFNYLWNHVNHGLNYLLVHVYIRENDGQRKKCTQTDKSTQRRLSIDILPSSSPLSGTWLQIEISSAGRFPILSRGPNLQAWSRPPFQLSFTLSSILTLYHRRAFPGDVTSRANSRGSYGNGTANNKPKSIRCTR